MILGIDTALSGCSVALVAGNAVHASRFELIARGHAERLVPMTGELLAEAGITPKAISAVAVAAGPGSFTGIRVGLAAARALALAWGVPCHGVSSLAATALAGLGRDMPEMEPKRLLAAIDASRGQVYAQVFTGRISADGAISLIENTSPAALSPQDAAALATAEGCTFTAGSGAALVHSARPDTPPSAGPEWTDAVHIARLAQLAGFRLPPQALYVRSHDALLPGGRRLDADAACS